VYKMRRIAWMIVLLVCLFAAAGVAVPSLSAANTPAEVVGRVYYIEGDLLRYVPEEEDWAVVVKDAPFGIEDTLFSGSQGMAELIAPNGTWIRVGDSTQIQVFALDTEMSELDVAGGIVRFYNKGSDTVIKATSSFGYVLADPGAVFDFYVGENSVEVVALRGTVSFVHTATDARYDVSAGSPSILADYNEVASGEGDIDPDWDRWNNRRESFWATKARVRGRSAEYLPPNLRDEAYALEENGRWETVSYEGASRRFWRPTTVAIGWSPFTVGRWTYWYGDQCWIPAEPFGYVTHHYGNWVYVRNSWYWAPPVVSVRVGIPLLDIGFFWYPGRVSWIHTATYVGWVPLAPRETYYSHRNWGGPHTVVVTNINITQININVRNYAYVNQAVVVNQNNFYRVNNYRDVRVRNINRNTLINNYRGAPVVNNTVIKNYATNKQRFNYTNIKVKEKPHNAVIDRIQHNKKIIQGGREENAAVVKERAKNIKAGQVKREIKIETPKTPRYIVPVGEVNRPKSEIKTQQREIKGRKTGASQAQPVQVGEPKRVIPGKPKPVPPKKAKPVRVVPVKPTPKYKVGQPIEKKETEKIRILKPDEKAVEAIKESEPPEKAVPEKLKKSIKTPPKRTIETPEKVEPAEKVLEKSREFKPSERIIVEPKEKAPERDLDKPEEKRMLEKQIEKSREPVPEQIQIEETKQTGPSERDLEKSKDQLMLEKQIKKQRERKHSEEEVAEPEESGKEEEPKE
jgi:hypothetical protein